MTRVVSVVPEDFEQELVMRWAEGQAGNWPELALLHHIPNGGKRGKSEAAKLKRMGVKRGVPDLCLPVPRGAFIGLYVEMKKLSGGRLSPEQRTWLNKLAAQGHMVTVAQGHEQAITVIRDYLAADGADELLEVA